MCLIFSSSDRAATRDRVGLAPLKQILGKLGKWPMVETKWSGDKYAWENAFIYLRSRFGLNYIISMYVDVDSKNTSRRIIYVSIYAIESEKLLDSNSFDNCSIYLDSLHNRFHRYPFYYICHEKHIFSRLTVRSTRPWSRT